MFHGVDLSDESAQILLFVCVPLSGLLVLLVVLLIRSHLPSVATFPTFSLTLNSVGWQQAYLVYREGDRLLDFAAQIDRKGRIVAEVPKELCNEELRNILPNLVRGLAKLRRQYLIYRRREPQPIPVDERDAAVAQLRQMGVELQEPNGPSQIQRAVIHNWTATSGSQGKAMIFQVQSLMSKARGVRENIEVLAQSDIQNSAK